VSFPALFADADTATLTTALRRVDVEHVMFPVLVQLGIIIIVARIFAVVFRRLKQPTAVGEIAAGLVLGPSVLGYFFPGLWQAIFHPTVAGVDPALFDVTLNWIFTVLSQVGLMLLLFLVGLEFDFAHLRWNGKSALAISIAGILLPFALALGIAPLMLPYLEVHPDTQATVPTLGFTLFLGTALSITALPILGRMMVELNIARSRLGTITISAAAVDDAAAWIILATVTALVGGHFEVMATLRMLGLTLAFVLAMIFLVRPALRWWLRIVLERGKGELGVNALAVVLVMIFACSLATNRIGIFGIFGAFLLGAILSSEHEFRESVARRLRDFVTVFFLPIFFTYTGLRTNIGSLDSGTLWLLCGVVLAVAIIGKFGGCMLAARLTGFSSREAACIGTMMNTRALMELIVINVGYDLRVIPPSVFCMLVIMALTTTIMTTPILLWLMRGTELEPLIRNSGFIGEKT
jgi:Kef-type K+ transport system membrane component KefB